jgi:D-alanine-D-alanine ligase
MVSESDITNSAPIRGGRSRRGLRIAVLHNLKKHAMAERAVPADAFAELDSETNVAAYAEALRAAGHHVTGLDGNADLVRHLRRLKVDICFNTCEGYHGDAREAQVPALLEMIGMPYTGGKVTCLANTLDKSVTKRILQVSGLPTPRFQEFTHPDLPLDSSLRFPMFIKPNREGTGIGIDSGSLVREESQLRARVAKILTEYRENALVEEYIPGRDVTCGLIGNLSALDIGQAIPPLTDIPFTEGGGLNWNGIHIFPISEIDYGRIPNMDPFYSFAVKSLSVDEYPYWCPAPLPEPIAREVMRLTLETFRVTQSLDFARVDFRLHCNEENRPYIIEINSLPGLTPVSDLVLCAQAEGWTYQQLIQAVLHAGAKRNSLWDEETNQYRRKNSGE